MSSKEVIKAYDIALEVRAWAEEQTDSNDLRGWCAKTSGELHNRLRRKKIKGEIHIAINDLDYCHVFVVVDDHVIDPTASQFKPFSNTTVLMLHKKEAECHPFFETTEVVSSAKALRKYQQAVDWSPSELAYG